MQEENLQPDRCFSDMTESRKPKRLIPVAILLNPSALKVPDFGIQDSHRYHCDGCDERIRKGKLCCGDYPAPHIFYSKIRFVERKAMP